MCKNIDGILASTKLLVSHSPEWEQEHTGGLRILWQKSKVERVLKYQTIIPWIQNGHVTNNAVTFEIKHYPETQFSHRVVLSAAENVAQLREHEDFYVEVFVIFLALI